MDKTLRLCPEAIREELLYDRRSGEDHFATTLPGTEALEGKRRSR